MEKKKKTVLWIIVVVILIAMLILTLLINPKQNTIYLLKDKSVLSQDKCAQLEKYVIVYQTGCPFCAKVIPRIQQVEQDLNVTFKHYNLAIKPDFDKFKEMRIMPEGVPAVIINCKTYLGAGYSIEEYKGFIQTA